ncbi:MAG TPA: PhzF family phenazine biosynthesis protein [Rubrobacteraceae bacterium]|nr:PhzF family phenazine biosynthesis protein [Rubrobacteraceae bacterium]
MFVGDGGAGGNPLGVFLEGRELPEGERQGVAADLGFSETVFVEDPGQGRLRIFTPKEELPFAGHPLVGTAWLLAGEGFEVSALRPPAGEVPVRVEGDITFISGRPDWAPPFEHIELGSPAEVEALAGPPDGHDLAGAWAWEDEEAGYVRARVFPVRLGIEEDEATGAHAVRLAAKLRRTIVMRQGEGSLIFAEPRPDGTVEIGGRTELVEVCEH